MMPNPQLQSGAVASRLSENPRPGGRWVIGLQVLLLVFLCSCGSTPEPAQMDMTAQKIVMRHGEAAFEVAFDPTLPADHAALTEFRGAIRPARTREALAGVWVGIPVLKARGADFLEVQIFARAARDSDWPPGGPPLDERTVYVEGVGMALDHVLTGEQEEER